MKKLIFVMFSFITLNSFCQHYTYAEIRGIQKIKIDNLTILINYGQKLDSITQFKNMVEALNFMSGKGWEFVQAYSVPNMGIILYIYIIRKKNEVTLSPQAP